MKVIVQIVNKIHQEAHITIPNGLTEEAIKQYITDRYNSGELTSDLNIFQVDLESISAQIVKTPQEVVCD